MPVTATHRQHHCNFAGLVEPYLGQSNFAVAHLLVGEGTFSGLVMFQGILTSDVPDTKLQEICLQVLCDTAWSHFWSAGLLSPDLSAVAVTGAIDCSANYEQSCLQGYDTPTAILLGTRMLYLHLIPRHCTSSNVDPIPRITSVFYHCCLVCACQLSKYHLTQNCLKLLGLSAEF